MSHSHDDSCLPRARDILAGEQENICLLAWHLRYILYELHGYRPVITAEMIDKEPYRLFNLLWSYVTSNPYGFPPRRGPSSSSPDVTSISK